MKNGELRNENEESLTQQKRQTKNEGLTPPGPPIDPGRDPSQEYTL
jgi:hypothetical protein